MFRMLSPADPILIWVPVDAADTLYVGQLVQSSGDGFIPLAAATGAADVTNKSKVFGIVVGTSNATPVFDSSYNTEKITGVVSQADQKARDWRLQEGGMLPKSDSIAAVQIALIQPHSVIRGTIESAVGTAPGTLTVTSASTDGLTITASGGGGDATAIADIGVAYCRSGANRGLYRVRDDTSASVGTVDVAFPNDIAVGDVFVPVNLRQGLSRMQIDSEAFYVDSGADLGTNYFHIKVLRLDLEVAGKEYVDFMFTQNNL